MTFVLFALFIVALMLILVGFLLSPKAQSSVKQKVLPPVQAYRVSPTSMNRRVRVRPSQGEGNHRARGNMTHSHIVKSMFGWRIGQQTPWLGIVLILLSLLAFGVFSLNMLIPRSTFFVDAFADQTNTTASSTPATHTQPQLFSSMSGASKALTRLSQLDVNQYGSSQEYDKWAYSACSAAALTEVFNAYGRQYRVTDVLSLEASIGEITPELGLVEPVGIDRTAARFGFKATWLNTPSLDDMLKVANNGRPVIISFPPDRWSGGHILIAIGGDSNNVYLADTSRLNMKTMPRATFLKYWAGFAVVVTPN